MNIGLYCFFRDTGCFRVRLKTGFCDASTVLDFLSCLVKARLLRVIKRNAMYKLKIINGHFCYDSLRRCAKEDRWLDNFFEPCLFVANNVTRVIFQREIL